MSFDEELRDDGRKIGAQLMTRVNTMMSHDQIAEGMLEAIEGGHNTLQQSVMSLLWQVVSGYEPGSTDLRNEDANALSQKIREMQEAGELPEWHFRHV